MHLLKIECIIGVWRDGKCDRKWWTYYSLHMIEALEFFFFFGIQMDKVNKKKLKIWGGFLRKGKCVREKNGGGLVVGLSDGRQWHSLRVSETQWVWERRVREMGWGGWVKWEGVGSVYKFVHIYIYLVILLLIESGLGSSPSLGWVSLKPELVSGFILNIQTHPYCFTGRVKPTPLGAGGVGPDTHELCTFCHT